MNSETFVHSPHHAAIQKILMDRHGISAEQAETRAVEGVAVIEQTVKRQSGSRLNTDVILAALDAFAAQGVTMASAQDVTLYLHKLGLVAHTNARAIGDALGNHAGGLGLESRKVNGRKHYLLPGRESTPTGDTPTPVRSE